MKIIKKSEPEEQVGNFINEAFIDYAKSSELDLNYEEYWFVAEDTNGNIIGSITGRAYYNEVHIGDLIVDKACRGNGLGSRLVSTVEDDYRKKGYAFVTLTTFGFQAPEFYRKLGYRIEFVRQNENPDLNKYFFRKDL